MRFKKILIILGGLLALLLVVSLLMTYLGYSKAKKIDSSTQFKDYFPFGKGGVFDLLGIGTGNNQNPDGGNVTVDDEPNNKLIRVSEEPVAGYTFVQKEFFPDSTPVPAEQETTVTVTPVGVFERELKLGSTGEDVTRLQKTLNACPELGLSQTGPGSPGRETSTYGERTVEGVKKFQLKFKAELITGQNLTDPSGILDTLTRTKLSSSFICQKTTATSPTVRPGAVLKTVIRYIEKGTGNVYDFLPENKETSRLTNQTIPRIQEAFFGDNGNKVFLRYVKEDNQTIETYFATVPKQVLGGDGSEGELAGSFQQKNIIDLVLNPEKTTAFLQTVLGTNAQGGLMTLATGNTKQFFSSPFFEWLAQWVTPTQITMTTKASGFVVGHMYVLNTQTGNMEKVLGDIFGLTTNTNPELSKILFSKSTDRSFIFGMHDLKDRKNYSLNVNTLPEKCSWSKTGGTIYCGVPRLIPGGVYPDDWYQGISHMSDQIIRIDPTQLYDNEILVDPEDEGVVIDTVNIQVDDAERYTAFIDKTTNILYMVFN